MKSLLFLFFILTLCVLVIGTNLSVDPNQIYQKEFTGLHHSNEESFTEKATAIILSGSSVAVPYGFNERLFFKNLILNQTKKKDLAILGSSQTAQLDHTQFPHLEFLNSSILTFTIQDILGLISIYEKRNLLPQKILIAAEASLLNKTTASKNALWKSAFENDVEEIMGAFNLPYDSPKKAAVLWSNWTLPPVFSPSYFQESLHRLTTRFLSAPAKELVKGPPQHLQPVEPIKALESFEPFATSEASGDTTIYRPDGSLTYKNEYNQSSEETARRKAIDFASRSKVHGLEDFDHLDPKLKNIFETLIRHLIRKGAQVTLLLLPYHPESYQRLIQRSDTQIIREVEAYYLGLKTLGIRVFGSFDPALLGYTPKDFFDHSHLRKTALDRLQTSEFFTDGTNNKR